MATRPVYLPLQSGPSLIRTEIVEFEWSPGLALSQKQKSIASLHRSAESSLAVARILEISSKSTAPTGRALSAFNMTLPVNASGLRVSVECAFQGSKIFERGGPYTDLYAGSSRHAKTDPRLKESGRLLAFDFEGDRWPVEPQTAFYDWLYAQALLTTPQLAACIGDYDAFTDIEFNPEKSINCQAYSAALFSALASRDLLTEATASKQAFLEMANRIPSPRPAKRDQGQASLF